MHKLCCECSLPPDLPYAATICTLVRALQYLLKHYQQADVLVMATPSSAQEWGTTKLAKQLGTDLFQPIDDHNPLVLGRVKCTDCTWMHLAIDQSLLLGKGW